MNKTQIAAAGFALAVTALIIPAAAFAQESFTVEAELDRPVEYVAYSDVDLSSESGLTLLRGRVRGAARKLCIHNGVQPVKLVMDGRACYADAIAGAEEQIATAVAVLQRGEQFAANARVAVRGARLSR